MSSLAQQLKRIGTADATKGSERAAKHRASFLFDSKQAADYDLDTIYSIGVNGITELKQLDQKFAPFEKTLFSESMKGMDRTLQGPDENSKLDESIALFLQQLSPYFLLKPAGKAIEWLVRRFRIHELNVDAILSAFLPYHETALFVTMVSILEIDEAGRWSFLRPIRKSRIPLDRVYLVQNMLKDRSIVTFVCDIMLQAAINHRVFKTLASFYTSVLMQYTASLPVVSDDILTVLMPFVMEGLKSKQPEYQLSTYMVVSQLCERSTLSPEVLSSLITAITSKYTNPRHMAFCVIQVYQSQETLEEFPERAFKNITRVQSIETIILSILQEYRVHRFLRAFLLALAKDAAKGKSSHILCTILRGDQVPSSIVVDICSEIADQYLEQQAADSTAPISKSSKQVLQVLQERYSEDLDMAIQEKLQQSKDDSNSNAYDQLYTFISEVFQGTRHHPMKDSSTTLFLAVNNPEPSVRLLAIKKFGDLLADPSSELANKELNGSFVKDTLLARVQDDNEKVVQHVLSIKELNQFVEPSDLLEALMNVVTNPRCNTPIRGQCLVYMLSDFLVESKDMKNQVLSVIIGNFLLSKESFKTSVLLIAALENSSLKNHPIVKGISAIAKGLKASESATATDSLVSSNVSLIKILAENASNPKHFQQNFEFYLQGLENSVIGTRIMSALVLTRVVCTSSSREQVSIMEKALPVLLRIMESQSSQAIRVTDATKDGLPAKEFLTHLCTKEWTTSVEVSIVHFSLLSMISVLKKPSDLTIEWLSSSPLPSYASIVETFYKAFVGRISDGPFEQMIVQLFKNHLDTDSFQFLCRLWTDPNSTSLVRLRSIQIASANLNAIATAATEDASDFQVVIPVLLLALSSPIKAIRETAVSCLESIASIYPKVKTSGKKGKSIATHIFKFDTFYGTSSSQLEFLVPEQASSFLDHIISSREEFVADGEYLGKYLSMNLNHAVNDSKVVTGTKDSLLSYLLSHVLANQRTNCRVELLRLLENVESNIKLKMLLPLIESVVQVAFTSNSIDSANMELSHYLVKCFSSGSSSLLESKSGKYRNVFLQLLKLNESSVSDSNQEGTGSHLRHLALQRLNARFFAGLSVALRREIFVVLIDLVTKTSQETVRLVKQVLKEIEVSSDLIIFEMAGIQSSLVQGSATNDNNSSKRQRKADNTLNDTTEALYRLVAVLELLETREVTNSVSLITPMFELLSTIMDLDLSQTPVSVDYINQLILSSLTSFINRVSTEGSTSTIDESVLRVDLVVNTIRATSNPQTHNQALLLIAAIATLFPEKVLHNIMPVFTFMGANVLRQDDNYSFHVIQQTLEKIVPALVSARRNQGGDSKDLAAQVRPIVKVFVDAIFHIPKHRRLRLFSVLISTLGEGEFLYVVISLLLEKQTERASKGHQGESDALNEFALVLSSQFSAAVQMTALIALIGSMQSLPNEKSIVEDEKDETEYLFDLKAHNNKHIRQFKLTVLLYCSGILTSKSFVSKVLARASIDMSSESQFEGYYLQLSESLLSLVGSFTSFVNELSSRKEQSGVAIKFWRGIVKVTYDVMDKVHAQLSLTSFVKVVVALFEHRDITVRRKAMMLFNQKVSKIPGGAANIPTHNQDAIVAVAGDLTKVLESPVDNALEEDIAVNRQTALLCLSTITQQFGSTRPGEIVKILPTLLGPNALSNANEQVKASSLVCLTMAYQEIGIQAVPFLPKFMPVVLSILRSTLVEKNPALVQQSHSEDNAQVVSA
ncbi:HEAT repeat-containing protein 1, partial [Lunasporangiospora selenospora]